MRESVLRQPNLLAAILCGLSGAAMLNLSPLYLAAATNQFLLNDRQMGWLMSVEIAGIALASLLARNLIPRLGYRMLAQTGLLTVIMGNILCLFVSDFGLLLGVRFLTGLFGDGLVYAAAIVLLGQRDHATRAFALLSFTNMCFTGLMLSLLPHIYGGSWPVAVSLLALVGAIALIGSRFLPAGSMHAAEHRPQLSIGRFHLLALVMLSAFTINLGAVWGYLERIGHAIDLNASQIGFYLGISMLFQALGSLTAVACRRNTNGFYLLLVVLVLQLSAMLLLSQASTPQAYAGAAAVWGYSWNLGLANLLGLIARLPESDQVLPFAPGAEALGAAMGPMLVASLLVPGDYQAVHTVAGISVVVSISLAMRLAIHHKAAGQIGTFQLLRSNEKTSNSD